MTVGQDSSPLTPPLFSPSIHSLHPLLSLLSSPVTLPPISPPLLSFPSPFLCAYPYLLDLNSSAKELGELCKLPHRIRAEPGRQTFLLYFQAEISAPFHFHGNTLVTFTATFGRVQRRHDKIHVGTLDLGHRTHNLLAVGAIAPMETAPMEKMKQVKMRRKRWLSPVVVPTCPQIIIT